MAKLGSVNIIHDKVTALAILLVTQGSNCESSEAGRKQYTISARHGGGIVGKVYLGGCVGQHMREPFAIGGEAVWQV